MEIIRLGLKYRDDIDPASRAEWGAAHREALARHADEAWSVESRESLGAPARLARRRYRRGMCRNIRTLHHFEPPATEEEIRASALQYVRKLSGYREPSRGNQASFDRAVQRVADATRELLASLTAQGPPRDRETERRKAIERGVRRERQRVGPE